MKKNNIIIKEKIINFLMKNGNKTRSENLLLTSIKNLQKKTLKNHEDIIKISIINSAPSIELKEMKKKKRKTVRYLTYVLNHKNRINKSMKNIINSIENKESIKNSFTNCLIYSSKENTRLQKDKVEKHKKAILKKKYANFRWFY